MTMTLLNANPLGGNRPDWFDLRACAGADVGLFFPENRAHPTAAVRICFGCSVRAQCLQYAIDNGERYGVFGGMTANQRDKLRWPRKFNGGVPR